jgi:hypothetical protein
MEKFGKFSFGILIAASAALSTAFAIVLLWRWFAVPVFHVQAINWRAACGLTLLVAIIHPVADPEWKDDSYSGKMARGVARGIIAPWLFVLIGLAIR